MIQINPRIQPLKFLGSGPGSKIPCWSQSLRAVTFAAHFATPSGYYFFECPARRTPLKWLKNFRRSLCRSTKRNRKALWPFQKQGCASVPGGVLVGQGMGSIPSYTIYEPVFGCLKRVWSKHYAMCDISLSIAISTGETDPGSGASTAATQQMGQPKAWKTTLLSQLYRQAEIKERISKNTVATLTYAEINYWMVLVWPSDFLACSWKPRSSTHVSQHWGH